MAAFHTTDWTVPLYQVRVYGRPDRVCVKCAATKRWLKRHGIPYQYINIDADPEGDAFVRELGALEVPVVVAEEEGLWWSGHRIPKLEELAASLASTDEA